MTVVLDIGTARMKWALAKDQALSSTGSALHEERAEDAIAGLNEAWGFLGSISEETTPRFPCKSTRIPNVS